MHARPSPQSIGNRKKHSKNSFPVGSRPVGLLSAVLDTLLASLDVDEDDEPTPTEVVVEVLPARESELASPSSAVPVAAPV